MLQKFRDYLVIALLVILILVAALILSCLVEMRQYAHKTAPEIQQVIDHLDFTSGQLEAIATDSRKPLRLILKHADEVMGETANTMKAIAQTSREVRDEQEKLSAASLHSVNEFTTDMASLTATSAATLRMTTDTVQKAGMVMESADHSLQSLRLTLDSANDLITSPSLNQTMANADRITASWALISDDSQKKWHNLLYPPPYQGRFKKLHSFWNFTQPILRLGGELGEPVYYLTNIK